MNNLARRRSLPAALLIGAVLGLSGCAEDAGDAAPAAAPPQVGVVTLQPESVTLTAELPGRATPYRIAEVRPQVGGIITERLFEEGAEVTAGDALYQIDRAPYEAALASAEAQLARAQASLESAGLTAERYADLIAIDAVSREELDQAQAAVRVAEADVAAARAAVQSAQIDLAYTRISSPIDGRIGRSSVTVGALVSANQAEALATVRQLDPIYIDFTQSSSEMLRLRRQLAAGALSGGPDAGAEVQLLLEDGSRYPHPATLQLAEVAVDPSTGAVSLRAVAPNPDALLMPGMYLKAQLPEGTDARALLVPQRGVTRDARGQPTALVVEADGTVAQRTLELSGAIGHRWRVVSGLSAGDRVIVEGLQRVRPGARAQASEFEAQGGDAAPAR